MTKIRFYIYTLFALLLTACSESEMLTGSDGSQNGIPVVINASFRIPKTGMLSRVCGESTEITSLYALIFDEHGLLSEIEECHPGTEANPQKHFSPMGANSLISFYVTLHESHSPRIVHLLANYPCSSLDIIDESHLMRKLTVSNHVDAYWQRIELRDGIIPEQNSNTPTQETRNHFQNISMIRNFAKITISKDTANIPDSKFKINGYLLIDLIVTKNTFDKEFLIIHCLIVLHNLLKSYVSLLFEGLLLIFIIFCPIFFPLSMLLSFILLNSSTQPTIPMF